MTQEPPTNRPAVDSERAGLAPSTQRVGSVSAFFVSQPMPPTFLYILALMVYFVGACAVWLVAVILAFSHSSRALAKKIAAGMAGSFPGVFLFQLISAPLVALILLTIAGISQLGKPPDIIIAVIAMLVVPLIIGIPAIASLLGFYTGWRIAWELAAGRSAREFLRTDRILAPIVGFLRRRLPFVEGWL